jgi:hypothetical protein
MPQVEITLITLSNALPRCIAAKHPNGIPTINDNRIDKPPTLAETGNLVIMIEVTVRPLCFKLSPNSPLIASDMYVIYRWCSGLSKPNFASRAFCAVGLIAFSDRNGPPGTIFIKKKVMVATANIVITASNNRFITYLIIGLLLLSQVFNHLKL